MNYELKLGDCLDVLKTIADNSIDSIVTDPPYGLSNHDTQDVKDCMAAWLKDEEYKPNKKGFMSKTWDSWVPSPAVWKECLRVLKPGGHCLVFAGTRSQDLMGLSLRLSGFEIRDSIRYMGQVHFPVLLYGQGFPKSLDISKALDKQAGQEREVIGVKEGHEYFVKTDERSKKMYFKDGYDRPWMQDEEAVMKNHMETAPATEAAKKWDGWGSSLKPSWESVLIGQKPYDLYTLCIISVQKIRNILCLFQLFVKDVEKHSTLNQNLLEEARLDSVLWTAVEKCNSREDLFALMDMSQSALETPKPIILNIGLSWLKVLADLLKQENMFTTEMETSLITDLKTLNCYLSKITENSMVNVLTRQNGIESNVCIVENILCDVKKKQNYIKTFFAKENVILKEKNKVLQNNIEPIIVCRKPLEGKIIDNVMKHGTGGINIDESRIKTDDKLSGGGVNPTNAGKIHEGWQRPWMDDKDHAVKHAEKVRNNVIKAESLGRFPSNTIHDGSKEILKEFDDVNTHSAGNKKLTRCTVDAENQVYAGGWKTEIKNPDYHQDTGSVARFFKSCEWSEDDIEEIHRFYYTSKASREDREEGIEDTPTERTARGNNQGTRVCNVCGLTDNGKNDHSKCINNNFEYKLCAATKNNHPTVKNTNLMRYLCKLVTPKDGIVLDPFMGSGSTGKAAMIDDFKFYGIEQDEHYYKIAEQRIKNVDKEKYILGIKRPKQNKDPNQQSLF